MSPDLLRALIFDVDGTLADTEEFHRQAFNAAFTEMTLDWEWGRDLYTDLLQISGGKERIGHYIDLLPITPPQRRSLRECIPMIHQTKTRLYRERLESGQLSFRPGVMNLLVGARETGIKLAIATTTTLDNVHALLDSVPGRACANWFSAIGAGDMVEHKKPAPDIYNLVRGKLGVQRHECVAFEDSVNGLRAAKAAELFTIVTPTQWNQDHDFTGADLILPGLDDSAGRMEVAGSEKTANIALGPSQIERLLLKTHSVPLSAKTETGIGP